MRYETFTGVLLLALVLSQGTTVRTTPLNIATTGTKNGPAARGTTHGQLPPEIMLDSHLLRAEEAVAQRDQAAARAAMQQIKALQDEHPLEVPAEYHYRYANVWNAVGAWDESLASAVRYLELTGRDGDHYLDALRLMNRATAAIEELERARELRAADEARARAAAERARAERERALRAAADAIVEMAFVPIRPGRFRMGTSDRESTRYRRTQVQLTQAYEIARYEVTQSQWEAVIGEARYARRDCERCALILRSLDEVPRFISMLNTADGGTWTYRLPTEAEWEYAARAGEGGDRFVRDLEASAWFEGNSRDADGRWRVHPVGLKRPNGFGLYDIFGNAAELTQDWYGPYPGETVTDPTGHPTGIYWETSWAGRRRTEPRKVARGCDHTAAKRFCERDDRTPFYPGSSMSVGLRLVRVPR